MCASESSDGIQRELDKRFGNRVCQTNASSRFLKELCQSDGFPNQANWNAKWFDDYRDVHFEDFHWNFACTRGSFTNVKWSVVLAISSGYKGLQLTLCGRAKVELRTNGLFIGRVR